MAHDTEHTTPSPNTTHAPGVARYLLVLLVAGGPALLCGALALAARTANLLPAALNLSAYGAGWVAQRLTALVLGRTYPTAQVPPLRQPPAP